MIKLHILWVVVCLSLGMNTLASASDSSNTPRKQKNWTTLDKGGKLVKTADTTVPFYTIPYIKENQLKPGVFETEGYITFINQIKGCRTPDSICPPGSDTSVIIIHDQKNGPSDTAIRIKITKDTKGLQKGQRYRFTIEAKPGNLTPQGKLPNLQLLELHLLQQ